LRGDTAAPVAKVMQVISRAAGRYHLVIEGHTDDRPIKRGSLFPSNWELSSARGIALLRQFEQKGVKDGFVSVESFAHTRPKVALAGLNGAELEQARAANRRVVIRIR
jgi:chemotaxis protein MotB